MAKWIEYKNHLINTENFVRLTKINKEIIAETISNEELHLLFDSEQERDARFDEIKRMLMDGE